MANPFAKSRRVSSRWAWLAYTEVEGVSVKIRHITDHERLRLEQKTQTDMIAAGKDPDDPESYWHAHTETLIEADCCLDWKIPVEAVPSLIDLEEYPTEPVPFSREAALALLRENLDLYAHIRRALFDRALFAFAEEDRLKKTVSASSDNVIALKDRPGFERGQRLKKTVSASSDNGSSVPT